MKKFSNIYYVFLILLAFTVAIISCGHPGKKGKHKHKKHKIEHRMKSDTIHNDSIRNARMKIWREKRKAKRDSIKK